MCGFGLYESVPCPANAIAPPGYINAVGGGYPSASGGGGYFNQQPLLLQRDTASTLGAAAGRQPAWGPLNAQLAGPQTIGPEAAAKQSVAQVQELVQEARSATGTLAACMAGGHVGTAAAAVTAVCTAQKQDLQRTYLKAYVELARMVSDYEALANSTACETAVQVDLRGRKESQVAKRERLSDELSRRVKELQESLMRRLEDSSSAEVRLRQYVALLSENCQSLPNTESDLEHVRTAIQALTQCANLDHSYLASPRWTRTYAIMHFDLGAVADSELDEAMNELCASTGAGQAGWRLRAAEVSEIAQGVLQDAPQTNTATLPLLGTCPHCEGDPVSGGGDLLAEQLGLEQASRQHARVCWDVGVPLTMQARRTDCSTGRKAVMCVEDGGREAIRTPPPFGAQ